MTHKISKTKVKHKSHIKAPVKKEFKEDSLKTKPEHRLDKKEKVTGKRDITFLKMNNYLLLTIALLAIVFLFFVLAKQYNLIGNKIAANVNGETISTSELEEEYQIYKKVFQISDTNLFSRRAMLSLMIDEKILVQEAIKNGFKVDDVELENYIDMIIASSMVPLTKDDFKNQFLNNNISYSSIRELYRKQLMLNKYLNYSILQNIKITEDDLISLYSGKYNNSGIDFETIRDVLYQSLYDSIKEEKYNLLMEELRKKSKIKNTLYSDLSSFAKCLSNKGVVFYGMMSTEDTKKQMLAFGEEFSYINYVECSDPSSGQVKEECADLITYPTWRINNILNPGLKSVDYLSDLTGCKIY